MEVVRIEPVSSPPRSWEALIVTSSPALLRFALMLTGSKHEAEDLFQATFARACRHGERIAAMDAPGAYLRRVMVNEHTSRRRRRRPATVSIDDVPTPTAPEGSTLDERDEAWRWLATLPRLQRAVLVLRIYEDLPDDEIADLVGCSRATVRSHASHGIAALRVLLTKREETSHE
jgi:RNA polymerase sigma-70 factor (sigma-E family)